ncbi:MAG: PLP-dependent aspartate aminotransferase family protein [Gemmatimonadota bacterium]
MTEHDLATLAAHAGRQDFVELGVHAPPLDLSSTYPVPDPDAAMAGLDLMVAGGRPAGNSIYARLHNPTVARFEDALATLEAAEASVAYASGMAAMTAALFVAAQEGGHVVAVRPLYGSTDHLLACRLLSLDVTFTTAAEVASALREDTSLVIVETPANPTLDLADISAVVDAAEGVPVLVDSTFATPVLQRPLDFGAAMVLHSATKFLGGHGDVIAGAIATSEERARKLRQVRVLTGALLHPLAAFLLLRGLPTLPLRVERAQATASVLADRLADHSLVARVLYPGRAGADPMGLVGRQMRGPGSILSFELPSGNAAKALMRGVSLITPAVSLGSTDSLIQHPAGLTHRVVEPSARAQMGIGDGLLRLSVGLESADALWADLSVGLALAESAMEHPATTASA